MEIPYFSNQLISIQNKKKLICEDITPNRLAFLLNAI